MFWPGMADEYVSIAVANYRTEPSSPVTPAIHTSTYSAGTLPEKSHIWQKLLKNHIFDKKCLIKARLCVQNVDNFWTFLLRDNNWNNYYWQWYVVLKIRYK